MQKMNRRLIRKGWNGNRETVMHSCVVEIDCNVSVIKGSNNHRLFSGFTQNVSDLIDYYYPVHVLKKTVCGKNKLAVLFTRHNQVMLVS